jgi:predicted DNA-binding protein (MmcQ/YjbR family)
MTHKEILDYSLLKKGAYLDYPFGPDCDIVKVRPPSREKGRIFVMCFTLRGEPKATLNCVPASAEYYRSVYPDSVVRGWHCPPVQQPYFNTVSLDGSVPDEVIYQMIDHAYEVVVAKPPKKFQKELEES